MEAQVEEALEEEEFHEVEEYFEEEEFHEVEELLKVEKYRAEEDLLVSLPQLICYLNFSWMRPALSCY